jgi:hypothetical protein
VTKPVAKKIPPAVAAALAKVFSTTRVATRCDWKGPRYREVGDKPPWDAMREKDHEWMRDWVCSRLADIARMHEERGTGAGEEDAATFMAGAQEWQEHTSEAAAIRAARDYGDVEPLRRMYPSIADFINLPVRKDRSNYKERPDHSSDNLRLRLKRAVAEAQLIRDLWQQHYDRRNRPAGTSTAEYIVALRHDLSEGEVVRKKLSAKRLKKK